MEHNKRDRAATTQRILQALGQVLDEEGLVGVRINRIAEKAAVSKVLIYRYFGSIEGLLDYYLQQGGVLPQFSAAGLDQLQPVQPQDVALVWSSQSLQ
ncbi:TetR/AcrR family transcriptional regulator, partial [Spirosoma endophyticum]